MDLNLNALFGLANLIPIAITLRKVYAPDFEIPETFKRALARLDTIEIRPDYVGCFAASRAARYAPFA